MNRADELREFEAKLQRAIRANEQGLEMYYRGRIDQLIIEIRVEEMEGKKDARR